METEKHKVMATGFAVALADGLIATLQFDEALHTIANAIREAARSGEEFELPEMLRVKAQILCSTHGLGTNEVDDCLICSLEHAPPRPHWAGSCVPPPRLPNGAGKREGSPRPMISLPPYMADLPRATAPGI